MKRSLKLKEWGEWRGVEGLFHIRAFAGRPGLVLEGPKGLSRLEGALGVFQTAIFLVGVQVAGVLESEEKKLRGGLGVMFIPTPGRCMTCVLKPCDRQSFVVSRLFAESSESVWLEQGS